MRKSLIGTILVGSYFLGGCSAALTEDEACLEFLHYLGEVNSTLEGYTENIDDEDSRNRWANRMSELGAEIPDIRVGDDAIAEAFGDYGLAVQQYSAVLTGTEEQFLADYENGNFSSASDELFIQGAKMQRLCS